MAIWPFSKNKTEAQDIDLEPAQSEPEVEQLEAEGQRQPDSSSSSVWTAKHDPVSGAMGPFDGDQVDISGFDFSDFAIGILDMGSIKIPLPKNSGVYVDADENGPQRLRIVTQEGTIIPVAFAAPRNGGLWAKNAQESVRGIESDGVAALLEDGPWGSEVVAQRADGTIRIIGVEGPRWMLRLTLAAPPGKEDALAQLGREVAARSFVYRGQQPILAGTSLPVTLPQQLVPLLEEQMLKAKQAREEAEARAVAADAVDETTATVSEQMRDLHNKQHETGDIQPNPGTDSKDN